MGHYRTSLVHILVLDLDSWRYRLSGAEAQWPYCVIVVDPVV